MPLRVCHVVLTDSPYGAFRVAMSLAKAQKESLDVVVATNSDSERFGKDYGVHMLSLPVSFAGGWPGGVGTLGLLRKARTAARLLETESGGPRFDLLHFHLPNAFSLALVYGGRARRLYTVHGVFFERALTKRVGGLSNRRVFGKGARVTVVNKNLIPYAAKAAHLRDSAINYIPNGIDVQQVRLLSDAPLRGRGPSSTEGRPLICFVGRLEKRKGPGLLLSAFAGIRKAAPGAVCVFLGDGPMGGALQARADALGIAGGVYFAGFQSNPYPLMKASDIVVANLSAALGGVSLVHMEAAVLRKPVVTLLDEDKREVFGASLYYTRGETTSEVENVVVQALRDLEAGTVKLATFDEALFSWRAIAARYADLYLGPLP